MNNNTDIEEQATVLVDELSRTYNNNLYTPLAHEVPIPKHQQKVGGPKTRYKIQRIKGDFHGGGRPLPHVPTNTGNSKYVPHIGEKQLAKLNRKAACAQS